MSQNERNTVRFLLDDELIELSDIDPNRTVLQWLREDKRRCGTKEGCAEGDCGACAIVVARLSRDQQVVEYHALNSCIQFLPTLDGKKLITVESLSNGNGGAHPVQQAMIDEHGSQCGFCTPGFVMSLYAAYQNNMAHTRREIDDTLAGNLCRCTGYRPIIAAAQKMYEFERPPSDADRTKQQLLDLQNDQALKVETTSRQYFAPDNLKALSALCMQYPDACLLAGGTDIGLWVTKEYRELDTLIYLGSVAVLNNVSQSNTHIEIGAAVTLTDALPVLLKSFPQLDDLLHRFAGPPIRNAATLGGNIANASPIGDSMPVLLVLDTTLVLRQGENTRELPLDQFFLSYQQTALKPGEFIEHIRIPLPDKAAELATYKVSKRFDQDISAVCAAYRVVLSAGKIAKANVAYGGMAAIPARARHCEQALVGQPWALETIRKAAAALEQDFTPLSDMRATQNYRMQVSKNLLLRFFNESNEPEAGLYRYGR